MTEIRQETEKLTALRAASEPCFIVLVSMFLLFYGFISHSP
jgi:hypothetical protein